MDTSLVFVKIITLLYRESLITNQTENSAELARNILSTVALPEVNLTLNDKKEELTSMKSTVISMMGHPLGVPMDKQDLLQRLKVNCSHNDDLYDAFLQGIDKDLDEDANKKMVVSMRRGLEEAFREKDIVKMFNQANAQITFSRENIPNLKTFLADFVGKVEPHTVDTSAVDPGIVGSVDIGNDDSIQTAFEEVKAAQSDEGIMKTGWQGLNTMLQGGFRRGEQWVIPALQHKYKTGFTLSLTKQFAIYNTPYMLDPKKKPLILRISSEDDLSSNLRFMYENLFFNEHGEMPDMKITPPKVMAKYVKQKLGVNGYHVKMERINPSEWTYKKLQDYVLKCEANGYEIHALIIDYLPMIPTTGCEEGPAGHALRDLYRRVRNFMSARKIILITPHQLSTDAKQLVRDGHQDFVKQVIGKGYFAGSKQIDQEVDGELYLHIEKLNKRAYLTLHRGKHRGLPVISDDLHYMVLPFPESGPIPDDLGKMRIDCTKVGGGPRGSGQEVPFHDFMDA
jgi:hypothetical protein